MLSAIGWAVAAAVFAALWFVFFLGIALIDEDVNHWTWPSDGGPGRSAHLRMLCASGLVALGVVALGVGLVAWLR